MVGWYSRFIRGEREIKLPLTKLLWKEQEWIWGENEQGAFEKLKGALASRRCSLARILVLLLRPSRRKLACGESGVNSDV